MLKVIVCKMKKRLEPTLRKYHEVYFLYKIIRRLSHAKNKQLHKKTGHSKSMQTTNTIKEIKIETKCFLPTVECEIKKRVLFCYSSDLMSRDPILPLHNTSPIPPHPTPP